VSARDAAGERAVAVPHARVDPAVLRRVIVEFVTRDGTDYGVAERSLDAKVADVMRQLGRGEAVLLYDTESDTTNVVRTPSAARTVETEVTHGRSVPEVEAARPETKDGGESERRGRDEVEAGLAQPRADAAPQGQAVATPGLRHGGGPG
jgi:uncharacterized protein YheU (UPF0270 family)